MIICYTFPEIWRQVSDVIAIFHFGQFLALFPPPPLHPLPRQPKKWKLTKNEKKKKARWGINIDHNCIKNHDHVLYCSWDMVCDWSNCYFSFWAIFCLVWTRYFKHIYSIKLSRNSMNVEIIKPHQCSLERSHPALIELKE